jgi:SAM-dependent methyltransferase
MLPQGFKGTTFRLADNWMSYVNVGEYANRPINYLEIGAFYGGNLISVANSYAAHKDSKLHAIDPWEDYDLYDEYKGHQDIHYNTFLSNVEISGSKEKIVVHRGYSHNELLKFEDEYFDIIYIDGNHNPEFVLEDAVLSFRKLKKNGILIFDDYGWGGPDMVKRGIDAFLLAYFKRISLIVLDHVTQTIVRKNAD